MATGTNLPSVRARLIAAPPVDRQLSPTTAPLAILHFCPFTPFLKFIRTINYVVFHIDSKRKNPWWFA